MIFDIGMILDRWWACVVTIRMKHYSWCWLTLSAWIFEMWRTLDQKSFQWDTDMWIMCDHVSCLKRASCAPERCGTHLWSQKRSTSQKAELFEHSKPVTSIDEFWSHSWHGRQRWKVWCLLLLALPICSNLIQFAQFVLTASCDSLAWKSTTKLLSYLCHLDFPVLVTWSSANNKTKKWGSHVQLAEGIWPRYVKNAWPALFVSTATAALVALLFAFELLPGWVKTSNYAPPEPHAPKLNYFFFNMKGFIHALSILKLDVAFGVVLHGWRKDCVGLA